MLCLNKDTVPDCVRFAGTPERARRHSWPLKALPALFTRLRDKDRWSTGGPADQSLRVEGFLRPLRISAPLGAGFGVEIASDNPRYLPSKKAVSGAHNGLVGAIFRRSRPTAQRSGKHYGVSEDLTSGSPVNFQMRRHAEVSASGWQPNSVLWDSELPSGWIGKRRPVWA